MDIELNSTVVPLENGHRKLLKFIQQNVLDRMRMADPDFENNPWMRRVAFFGDSMLKTTDKYFDLYNLLLPGLKSAVSQQYSVDVGKLEIEFKHFTMAGGRMEDIYEMANEYFGIWRTKGYRFPHIIMIYSVSDVDDVYRPLKKRDLAGANEALLKYGNALANLLQGLKSVGVMHTVVVGPTSHAAKGEIPTFWDEQKYLDDMAEINSKLCAEYGAIHMDTRSVFKSVIKDKIGKGAVPKDLKEFVGKQWPKLIEEESTYAGILTFDGEHPNYAGTKIIMTLFNDIMTKFDDVWKSVGRSQVP
jgi:hypothetical protein